MSSHYRSTNYPVVAVENRSPLEGKEKWPALKKTHENDLMQGDKHLPLPLENTCYTRRIDGEESNHETDFDTPTTSELLHSPDLQGYQNDGLVPLAISDNVRRALLSDVEGEGDNIRLNQSPQPNEDTHSFQPGFPTSSELSSKRDQVISKVDDLRLGAINLGLLHC